MAGVIVGAQEAFGVELLLDQRVAPVDGHRAGGKGVHDLFGHIAGVAAVLESDGKFVLPLKAQLVLDRAADVVAVAAAAVDLPPGGKRLKKGVALGAVVVADHKVAELFAA